MKIFITGGAGFIGHYVSNFLSSLGHEIIVFDNLSRHQKRNLLNPEVKLVLGDICNLDSLTENLKSVDVCIHLAAINGTENFYLKSDLVVKVGIEGTLNVIKACEKNSVKSIIFSSSAEVYANPETIPTDEKIPLVIPNILEKRFSYGGSKIAGELLMVHYASQVIERVLIFRPHNIYGPSMGNEHVIPQLLNKIALHKDNSQIKLQIQGNGLESRAFTYVTDLLQGLEILLSRGKNGEIYNIGNPKEVSILELIELIEKIIDKTINVLPGMIQSGSPLRRLPDISKIELLGFKPKVDIEEGLKLTIPHYLKS